MPSFRILFLIGLVSRLSPPRPWSHRICRARFECTPGYRIERRLRKRDGPARGQARGDQVLRPVLQGVRRDPAAIRGALPIVARGRGHVLRA